MAEKTYGGSNISLQLLCRKATPACECQYPFFLCFKKLQVQLGMLALDDVLTAKKATAVTTERLSGEARLVYIWLMAPGWFERLGAIVDVMCERCVAVSYTHLTLPTKRIV